MTKISIENVRFGKICSYTNPLTKERLLLTPIAIDNKLNWATIQYLNDDSDGKHKLDRLKWGTLVEIVNVKIEE